MENSLQGNNGDQQKRRWSAFFYTTLFCLAIGWLLYFLDITSSFSSTLIVSLSIGWSIHLVFYFLSAVVENFLPVYIATIPLTATGLGVGLLIAGLLVQGRPLLFFQDNYASLILGVFFGVVGSVIFSTRSHLIEAKAQLAQAKNSRQEQEKLQLETELKLLQAQIEPHFLFNTLSNVIGLIHNKPIEAEQTLINLTTLLRSSLRRTREQSVTLAEELTIVKAYLDIQKIRMQGRLSYTFSPENFENDPDLESWPLAPLLVQPIVENSVKHGIDPAESGGDIQVDVKLVGCDLQITIADTGVGMGHNGLSKESVDIGAGMGNGLSNVRNRLKTLYGDVACMTVAENKPKGVIVTLLIPRENQ